MDSVIIFCAKYLIFIIGLAAFGYWLTLVRKQKTELLIFGIITAGVAYILAKIGSTSYYDARPFVSDHVTALFSYNADNGFPSDHTLLAASVAVTIFALSRTWGIGFLILALIVGASRVLAHVHHTIDIIGSIAFAAAGGLLAYYLVPKILKLIAHTSYAKQLGLGDTTKTKQKSA